MAVVSNYTALISGMTWNGPEVSQTPAFVTYSFATRLPDYQAADYGNASFKPLTRSEQATVEKALKIWADTCGITLLKVDPGEGDLTFGTYDFDRISGMQGSDGFAYFPSLYTDTYLGSLPDIPSMTVETSGDVFFRRGEVTLPLALHEIGHALGLKHPFSTTTGHTETLLSSIDTTDTTVMSYTFGSKAITGLGPLDIAAVRALYGGPGTDGTQVAKWSWNGTTDTLTQIGRATSDKILGISTSDVIRGNSGNDSLSGLAGDDTLSGGAGKDVIYGGTGDDVLLPGAGQDLIYGGDGSDTLSYADYGSAVSVTLAFATGYAGSTNVGATTKDLFLDIENVIGTSRADTLTGNAAANILTGGAGADVLAGGGGRDTASYETARAGVVANLQTARLNTGDARGDSYSSIENLVGSSYSDRLTGNTGTNRIDGGRGNDTLDGGARSDVLTGGAGSDRFVFSTALGSSNVDRLTDFDPRYDTIALENSIFQSLTRTGTLSSSAFKDIDTGSVDRNDRILYDSGNGSLYYDADGSGRTGAIKFAILSTAPDLTASDLLVV
ncbi:hypothetical protein ACRC7T_03555 [Segnochrobactraceae bacterium EtOH-i3]